MATTEAPLSYQSMRSANQAREADEVKTEGRKKNILILMLQYLTEEGYCESANTLSKETNLDMSRYDVCDNIDLNTILMEYESYYYVKFSRYPKITKKLPTPSADRKIGRRNNSNLQKKPALPHIPANAPAPNVTTSTHSNQNSHSSHNNIRSSVKSCQGPRTKKDVSTPASKTSSDSNVPDLSLQGLVVQGSSSNHETHSETAVAPPSKGTRKPGTIIDIRSMIQDVTRMNVEEGTNNNEDRILKPLGGYVAYNQEWRDLAQVISRDIYSENPNVKWDDIIGLDEAKRLVKESVVYPIKYPQLFTGILSPWKGLLLYGPPGTGKTLLAKAVATECSTTFFNISASTIVSKWRGDSEKLVRVLFEMARFHAPSTIFLDELESLMSQRGSNGAGSEHEGSRRLKTELLVQMDGLAKSDDLVFLLAASNLPWELDHAMLRRLEKRILVDIPIWEARKAMFHHYLPSVVHGSEEGLRLHTKLDYDILAARTEGYSGSDLKLVCKEAAMKPVRKIFDALENHNDDGIGKVLYYVDGAVGVGTEHASVQEAASALWHSYHCRRTKAWVTWEDLHIKLDTLVTNDVINAIETTKPSVTLIKDKYTAWQREYGSV